MKRQSRFGPKGVDKEALPDFQHLIRQLFKKAHPDLVRSSNEEYAARNEESMQVLNGVLSSIKDTEGYPPAIKKKLQFHMKDGNGGYSSRELSINTGGGDSKKALTRTFATFFKDTGIHDGDFEWGKDYFPPVELKKHETPEGYDP
jgi:hypothetical protein